MLTYPFSQSYGYYYSINLEAVGVAILVAMILAVVFYFTFLDKKNEGKFKGFAAKVYNFFNFNKFYVEDVLRLIYVISVALLLVVSLAVIFSASFIGGLLLLVLGNVALRIGYELKPRLIYEACSASLLPGVIISRNAWVIDHPRRLVGISRPRHGKGQGHCRYQSPL